MGGFQDLLWISGFQSQHFLETCQWRGACYKCVWEQLWHYRPYPWCELSHHVGRHWRWSKKRSYLHLCYVHCAVVRAWMHVTCTLVSFPTPYTALATARGLTSDILCMGSSVLLFCSLWWWVGVSFVLSLSRCTDWGCTVSLTNMACPCLHNPEIQWVFILYILVHTYNINWCVGVLCAVVLTLTHKAVNLKLCASRCNIDTLKLKMASLLNH